MNFLAHLYLSGNDPMIKIGNFIGDHVKGRKYENYCDGIKKGILLHRIIDHYTDAHPLIKKGAERLQPKYKRYSGIVMDMFCDFILAKNWNQYSDKPLHKFVTETHQLLLKNYFILPSGIKRILPFIIKSRRLETYATIKGIERSLNIMSGHSSLPNETNWAIHQLEIYEDDYKKEFDLFIKQIQQVVDQEINNIS